MTREANIGRNLGDGHLRLDQLSSLKSVQHVLQSSQTLCRCDEPHARSRNSGQGCSALGGHAEAGPRSPLDARSCDLDPCL